MIIIYKDYIKDLEMAVNLIKSKTNIRPRVAIVLGSGLGSFVNCMQVEMEISYLDCGLPVSTVSGHIGRFLLGTVSDVPIIVMQGRVHYYEGYSMPEVVKPIRVMSMLGVGCLLLTNAAGGINEGYNVGDFMIIKDHISSFVPSPLIGRFCSEHGVRFPDMSEVYSKRIEAVLDKSAAEYGVVMKKGIYLQVTGSNYETPAEIKMYRTLGADAVGMSTVCEAMAARQMGTEVGGISLITNMAAGIGGNPLSHEEVKEVSAAKAETLNKILLKAVKEIGAGND